MRGRPVRTRKKDIAFIAALSQGLPVRVALEHTGYARRSVYEWRAADPIFRQLWDDAIDGAVDAMEAEADRRGMDGTLKPVFYRGEQCGVICEYSDTLLIFRLKALRPDKYRENVKTEIGGTITHEHIDAKVTLIDRVTAIAARAGQDGGAVLPQ